MVQITYPGVGNTAELGYDSAGRCSQIVGKCGGSITSTLNHIWCGADRWEVRDEGNNLLRQYFALGQMNFSGGSGTKYFYTKNHLGSTREVTNSSGALQSQFSYSPWGEPTQIAGSGATPDFGFIGKSSHRKMVEPGATLSLLTPGAKVTAELAMRRKLRPKAEYT